MAQLPQTLLGIGNNSNVESSCTGSEDQLFHYSSTPLLQYRKICPQGYTVSSEGYLKLTANFLKSYYSVSSSLSIALGVHPHFFEKVINDPLLIVFGPPIPFLPGNIVVNG